MMVKYIIATVFAALIGRLDGKSIGLVRGFVLFGWLIISIITTIKYVPVVPIWMDELDWVAFGCCVVGGGHGFGGGHALWFV